jgi:hypothetical protein
VPSLRSELCTLVGYISKEPFLLHVNLMQSLLFQCKLKKSGHYKQISIEYAGFYSTWYFSAKVKSENCEAMLGYSRGHQATSIQKKNYCSNRGEGFSIWLLVSVSKSIQMALLKCIFCDYKVKGKAIPLQPLTGPEGSRRLRLPDFKTIGTWRWQGCQPYALAALTPRKYSWYSFLLESESTPVPLVWLEDYVNE